MDQSMANLLLAAMASDDRQRVLSHARFVELGMSQVLSQTGHPLSRAWFPTSCIISLLAQPTTHPCFDVGMIGYEGVYGAGCALGVRAAAFDAVVTGPGHAWQVNASDLMGGQRHHMALTSLLGRFLYVELAQLGTLVACSRFHTVSQRLSRYLLMCQDRTRSPDILMTHTTLANMLGVRRAGVTVAAGQLQDRGLIRYNRGHIMVTDRSGLLKATCGCYAHNQWVYRSIMASSAGANASEALPVPSQTSSVLRAHPLAR